MSAPVLEVCDLRKRYGELVALDGVTLAVPEGELFGLLGPNGAGKTTLLSVVAGLLQPTSGEVRILGRPVRAADEGIRRAVGVVPQELALYGELTARENLLFFGRLYGLRGAELRRRVAEALALVGLEDRAGHRARTFSGGMQRRLNLALGLVHGPRLLLLDEPTTGVDPQSRNHIFEDVRRLNAAGLTVIYTSHYMEEVQALCPRVGIMDHGHLIACDSVPGLLRQLDGLIRARVGHVTPALRDRVKQLPGVRLTERDGHTLELHTADVQGTLLRLVGVVNDLQAELTGLETEEPNLERVFLHLTGRALRD
jgi:ABC-2 type transport system ATP-binding protein